MKTKIIMSAAILLLFVALFSATYAWYKERNKPIQSKIEYVDVVKVKEVVKLKKVEVPGPEKIVTIEKKVLVEKVKMPDWFSQNQDEQAIASAVIPSYEGNTNAIATINTRTGVGNIVSNQEPLSFVGFIHESEAYIKAGYNTGAQIETSVGVQWKFARIGKIKIGVFGEGRGRFQSQSEKGDGNVEAVGGVILTY